MRVNKCNTQRAGRCKPRKDAPDRLLDTNGHYTAAGPKAKYRGDFLSGVTSSALPVMRFQLDHRKAGVHNFNSFFVILQPFGCLLGNSGNFSLFDILVTHRQQASYDESHGALTSQKYSLTPLVSRNVSWPLQPRFLECLVCLDWRYEVEVNRQQDSQSSLIKRCMIRRVRVCNSLPFRPNSTKEPTNA